MGEKRKIYIKQYTEFFEVVNQHICLCCSKNKDIDVDMIFVIICFCSKISFLLVVQDAKIDGQSVVTTAATDSELPPAASDPQEVNCMIFVHKTCFPIIPCLQLLNMFNKILFSNSQSAGGSRSAFEKAVGVLKHTAKKTKDFGMKHRPEFTFDAKVPIFGGKGNVGVEKRV